MTTWLVPMSDLTLEQCQIITMPITSNRLVLGFAGSGKTQVLIHRAAHLVEAHQTPFNRFRIFVFTNVIKEYIRSGLNLLGLPDETVSTFDYWATEFYKNCFERRLPRAADGRKIDFPQIRRRVLGIIRSDWRYQKFVDFALVDEGQDLCPTAYEILRLAARHVTVFVDPQQKIFDDGADESFIKDSLGIALPEVTLLGAYRNAAYVANLAAYFIEDRQKRAQYLAQVSATQRVREKPLCYVADSFDQEMDRLAEVVRARQVMNERIGIIVPTNRLLHGIAEGLAERGVMVEKAATKEKAGKIEVTCSFTNLVPKIATFFMAKGLTFDSVLLPRLTDKAYAWTGREQLKRMMFVGIARATQWVYLSTVKGTEFGEIAVLREAAAQGHLTMQGSGDWKGGSGEDGGQGEPDEERGEDEDFSVL
jgi:superfamily I DNA/RNA helicase